VAQVQAIEHGAGADLDAIAAQPLKDVEGAIVLGQELLQFLAVAIRVERVSRRCSASLRPAMAAFITCPTVWPGSYSSAWAR
jgi:hypothetical protein